MTLQFLHYRGGDSRSVWEKYPDITYNHGGFPREYQFAPTKHTDSLQFTDDYAELNMLLDGIIPAGVEPADISHLDPSAYPGQRVPDFALTTRAGEKVFVECTRAGDRDVIRFEDKFPQIEVRLNSWLNDHSEAKRRLAGRYLAFLPQAMPKASLENAFVEEMQRFVQREDLTSFGPPLGKRVPADYPVLLSLRTLVLSSESTYSHIIVKTPAMSTGGPWEATSLALGAIEAKREQRYEGFDPIWLVVGISNLQWVPADIFKSIEGSIAEIAPFSRVFLCNSNETFEVKN